MHVLSYVCVALFLAAVTSTSQAQEAAPLPRVLIIGDSVYNQHTRESSKVLKGKVEVVYAFWHPQEIADTATTIELLDRHLGRIDRNGKPIERDEWPAWDLIHFNCGLGDLIHRTPGTKAFRVMPRHVGGIRNTPADRYARNLDVLVEALKSRAPGATLVWGSTTPIRASASNVFEKGSEVEYNRIAAEVMKKQGVPINDMHAFVEHLIDMDKPAGFGADPFHFDKKPIHMPIVRVIERTFHLPPMPVTEEERISTKSAVSGGARS